MATLKDVSKKEYSAGDEDGTFEEIQTGCIQRIADAAEKSCLDREKLERDYKYVVGQRNRWRDIAEKNQRQLSATRGVVTKLKNKKNDRIKQLEDMLNKKLDLIKCGIGANYSGSPYENELYTEVIDLLETKKKISEAGL